MERNERNLAKEKLIRLDQKLKSSKRFFDSKWRWSAGKKRNKHLSLICIKQEVGKRENKGKREE